MIDSSVCKPKTEPAVSLSSLSIPAEMLVIDSCICETRRARSTEEGSMAMSTRQSHAVSQCILSVKLPSCCHRPMMLSACEC